MIAAFVAAKFRDALILVLIPAMIDAAMPLSL